ncbi:MAG: hypothetical protein WC360_04000 [Opitutales bacterium]
MQNNIIKTISHGSYVLLSSYVGMAWGVAIGCMVFAGRFLSDDFHSMLPEDIIAGVPTSVAFLLFAPAFMCLVGLFLGWVSYPAFSFIVRATEGLKMKAQIEQEDIPAKALAPARRMR